MAVFNPGLIFFTWLAFGLLVLVLGRYAWGPIIQTLREREKKIHSDLQRAEEKKERAEFLVEEEENELEEARETAQRLITEKRREAEEIRTEIVNSAEEEARRKITEAEQRVREKEEEEFARLKQELGVYAGDLAERILKREITEADHEELVESFIADLEMGDFKSQ